MRTVGGGAVRLIHSHSHLHELLDGLVRVAESPSASPPTTRRARCSVAAMPRQVWFSTPAALAARFLRAELAFGRLALTVSPALVSIVKNSQLFFRELPRAHVAEIARPLPGASLQCSSVLRSRPLAARIGPHSPPHAHHRLKNPRLWSLTAS